MIGGYIGKPIGGVVQTTKDAGALTATLDAATLSSTGVVALRADAAITLDAATLSATGAVAIKGALAATLADAVLTATATLAIKGALAKSLEDATLASAAALSLVGGASITLDDVITGLTGEFGQTITDTEVLQLPVDCILAGQQHYKQSGREYEIHPRNQREFSRGSRSRVRALRGGKPSFTTTTNKRGYV